MDIEFLIKYAKETCDKRRREKGTDFCGPPVDSVCPCKGEHVTYDGKLRVKCDYHEKCDEQDS